jgi:hypothetical protein
MSLPTSPIYHTPAPSNFNARYIEDLRIERTYLLNSLRIENERATDLLNRVPQFENGVVDNALPQMRRRMRKQLGWVRHRLNETNQQEQAIMVRLGQLMEEIRWAEERNMQVEMESRQLQQMHDNAVHSMQMLHLDPTTPMFQPDGFQFPFPDGNFPDQSHIGEETTSEQQNMEATPDQETSKLKSSSMLVQNDKGLMLCGIAGESNQAGCEAPVVAHRSSSIVVEKSAFDNEEEREEIKEQRRHSLPIIPGVSQYGRRWRSRQ